MQSTSFSAPKPSSFVTIRSWARVGILSLGLLALSSCGGWTLLEDFPCPQKDNTTTISYENFAKTFLASYCNSCHSVNSTSRRGAPIAYQFDTYEATFALRNRIFLRSAANNTTMPPGPDDPPETERMKLAEWIACGAPKTTPSP